MESLSDTSSGLRVVAARYIVAYFPPRHFFVVWRLEPPFILNYDIQSRLSQLDIHSYQFSLAFRAVVSVRHSKPPSS